MVACNCVKLEEICLLVIVIRVAHGLFDAEDLTDVESKSLFGMFGLENVVSGLAFALDLWRIHRWWIHLGLGVL